MPRCQHCRGCLNYLCVLIRDSGVGLAFQLVDVIHQPGAFTNVLLDRVEKSLLLVELLLQLLLLFGVDFKLHYRLSLDQVQFLERVLFYVVNLQSVQLLLLLWVADFIAELEWVIESALGLSDHLTVDIKVQLDRRLKIQILNKFFCLWVGWVALLEEVVVEIMHFLLLAVD